MSKYVKSYTELPAWKPGRRSDSPHRAYSKEMEALRRAVDNHPEKWHSIAPEGSSGDRLRGLARQINNGAHWAFQGNTVEACTRKRKDGVCALFVKQV